MTFEQPPLDRQVEVQVDRLIDEDGGRHEEEEIQRMAQDVAAEHADAPVQQYVPNLIYNEIKTKLVGDEVAAAQDQDTMAANESDQRAV